jgi:hypothetical protein
LRVTCHLRSSCLLYTVWPACCPSLTFPCHPYVPFICIYRPYIQFPVQCYTGRSTPHSNCIPAVNSTTNWGDV